MINRLHELISASADTRGDAIALSTTNGELSYGELDAALSAFARGLKARGLPRSARVGIWLDKRLETVVAMFGATRAGMVFVPINPVLKEEQVLHILRDCDVKVLVSARERAERLVPLLEAGDALRHLVLVDSAEISSRSQTLASHTWKQFQTDHGSVGHRHIDTDMAAILYTSGSTGRPKGVVLSHRNMVSGAQSVATYLGNTADDRLLALLPLSFDAGFSQLSTAFFVGARVHLLNYLLPKEVPRVIAAQQITGLGAVPPVWIPLSRLDWPVQATDSLRYITNTGGAMPRATVQALREKLPTTRIFLMYGLTEAFRSTYLPPEELDRRPDSMGKAIPNAEILVVREDGSLCDDDEPGELVHRGALVSLGYWNDPEKTAARFRPAPGQPEGIVNPELAVFSGDTVRRDADGFLYFVGRRDEMIKTSGYRVSPTEIEETLYASRLIAEAAVFGVPHPELGQSIVAVVVPLANETLDVEALNAHCRGALPGFMVPARFEIRDGLPRNPNGKINRSALRDELLAEPA